MEIDEEILKKMVNAFLCWQLPQSFSPDSGISFKPSNGMSREEAYGKVGWWPVGTNLFSADEAHRMFEHVLAQAGITITKKESS